jgi:hypothetical protein
MRFRAVFYPLLGIVAAVLPGGTTGRQEGPFRDVFALMEEVDRRSEPGLWPGFFPRQIPAAIFDGRDTYLFGFGRPPGGFAPAPGRPDVFVSPGQHGAVVANRRVLIEGTWVATTIPGYGPSGNHRSKTLADIAAVVLHEKFHVFQKMRHPDWRPNDLVLLSYPLDRPESLARRRLELEAFRRAAADPILDEAAAWAKTGLDIRRIRLAGLSPADARYEREIARLEGLAQYIEHRAAGRAGPDDVMADDLAPRGIRLLGYVEGCWIGLLLDRFDPPWKERLEADDSAGLEALLASAIGGEGGRKAEFTPAELVEAEALARMAVEARAMERQRAEREFFTKLGYRIDLRPSGAALRFEMFDPFSIEALGEGRILHPALVSCRAGSGTVRTGWRPCLTEVDGQGRIVRMILTGIRRKPALRPGMNVPLSLDGEGVQIALGKGRVRFRENIVEIGIE